MRRNTSIDFLTHNGSGLEGQSIRGGYSTYLREINRISHNELSGELSSNWRPGDT